MEKDLPLCMSCADLEQLIFLPRGDAALTRRSKKYSTLTAVVVRFSRARKRYERQGILVEEEALARAEQECLADAEARQAARERNAIRREQLDQEYVSKFAEHIKETFPGCPANERKLIAEYACLKHSGRIGRSAAARQFDERALELAVQASIRHNHTPYDKLLAGGIDRREARKSVVAVVASVLGRWRSG